MAQATIRKLAEQWGVAGAAEMESLTNASGILTVADAIPASHDMFHKHKKLDALPTFSVTDVGGSLGDVTTNNSIYQTDLRYIKAHESEPADIVDHWNGGASAYFNDQRPAFLESFGQTASNAIVYGNDATFGNVSGMIGWHQMAKAYGNEIDAGGDSGATTTIFAVKFRSGSNGCGILYDGKINGAGQFMSSEVKNGGKSILETTNTTGRLKQEVYQVVHKGVLGFLSTSSYDVARIHSVGMTADDSPTYDEMQQLLDMVRAEQGNTFLFMNRLGRRALNKLKNDDLIINISDKEYNNIVESCNGVRIVLDENILSTESSALD